MQLPDSAPKPYDTFEARYLTQYLEKYIDDHIYQDKPLRNRIWLNHEVVGIEKTGGGRWSLRIGRDACQTLECSKLAVASGLTSLPNMPTFPLDAHWRAPILHHRDFGSHSKSILAANSPYKHVTVLGGGKSAADLVYAALKAGKNVNWVIRGSGEGPGIFVNPATSGRYRNAAEKMFTQNGVALNPSCFRPLLPWARALHQSPSDRELLGSKLSASDRHFKDSVNYRHREDALECFRELEPDATWVKFFLSTQSSTDENCSLFWNNGPVGLIQHDDFWDLVSRKVHAYRSDPTGTTEDSVVLEDGRHVATDILLCGTGWSSKYSFFTSEQAQELGLPHAEEGAPEEEVQLWHGLEAAADEQILRDFPILADPPASCKKASNGGLTPARLYQGIASINDRSIVFLGRVRVALNFRTAEAQAVWATAYWDRHISLPALEQMRREVAYMNTFSRRRYPSRGLDGLNLYGDLVWYTDRLLTDAGLSSHRKGWWEDLDEPCFADDLRDCSEEYLAKYGSK